MMKSLKSKASAAVLGGSLLGILAFTPAAHAAGRCGYQGAHSTLRSRASGAAVLHAQCLLKHYNGFASQRTTGSYDEATVKNVKALQTKHNLVPDGVVGGDTWNRLHPR
jgi:peptidoglycan hydrolase-like protein with peptidoglycan-binding domain